MGIEVLQYRIMIKDEQTKNSQQSEVDLRKRTEQLDKAFQDEAIKCRENTGEMARQYREMQESFNETIEVLQQQVAQAKQEIETVTREMKERALRKMRSSDRKTWRLSPCLTKWNKWPSNLR